MQQELIPYKTGDERLLVPGWAGSLSETELSFIKERLRRSRRLVRIWGDWSDETIRQVASGISETNERSVL